MVLVSTIGPARIPTTLTPWGPQAWAKHLNMDSMAPNAAPIEDIFTQAARRRREPDGGLVNVPKRAPSLLTVRTPAPTWYVRTSSDPEMMNVHDLVHAKDLDDNYYFPASDEIAEDIRSLNAKAVRPLRLHLAVTKQGTPFLWRNGLPNEEGALNSWHASAQEMIELAKDHWIMVTPNKQAGGYDYRIAERDLGEPVWLQMTWEEILRLAFRRYSITSMDHPIVRTLRGG